MSYGANVDGYAHYEYRRIPGWEAPDELFSLLQLATLRIWDSNTELFDLLVENGADLQGSLVTLLENPNWYVLLFDHSQCVDFKNS